MTNADHAGASNTAATEYGPWNPGIESRLPRALLPLSTMFRPANVATPLGQAEELRDLTGLDLLDLVAFRAERLILHEVLVRVTADLSVASGSRIEDLGINFRRMTNAILARLASRTPEVMAAYEAVRGQLSTIISGEVEGRLFAHVPVSEQRPRRRLRDFFRRDPSVSGAAHVEVMASTRIPDAIGAWEASVEFAADPLVQAASHALAKVVSAIVGRHGELWGTPELIVSVATTVACNAYGSDEIGRVIEPWFLDAARQERFALLPAQDRPVIMNTKGASAAGKSTMRPEQQLLAQRIGVAWSDFALISPDIWRKQLLDYASLGDAYKYGGACTGDELHIIDQKLDRYMAAKAQRQATTHLLIDRFRFDSFAPDSDEAGSNLLTRFGHTIYLFFMITPPEEIVTRAWRRGLEVGRYKAVDDLLAHNIEAYAGMPELFFTWALCSDKDVHYEFLDNTVPYGETPRTSAFGSNGELNVLDVKSMLDVQRFRRVDVRATDPQALYDDKAMLAPDKNTQFVVDCARRLSRINFADQRIGRVYLSLKRGVVEWVDAQALEAALADPETRAGILSVAPDVMKIAADRRSTRDAPEIGRDRIHTIGRWGPSEG